MGLKFYSVAIFVFFFFFFLPSSSPRLSPLIILMRVFDGFFLNQCRKSEIIQLSPLFSLRSRLNFVAQLPKFTFLSSSSNLGGAKRGGKKKLKIEFGKERMEGWENPSGIAGGSGGAGGVRSRY